MVKFVCDQTCLKNGHVLIDDGTYAGALIVREYDDPEMTALVERITLITKLSSINQSMVSLKLNAKQFDLPAFRKTLRKLNPGNKNLVAQMMLLAAQEYIKAFLKNSIRDYQIDWDHFEKWDKTDVWDYLRRPLIPKDYISLFSIFFSLAEETQKRNKFEIIEFLKTHVDPMIEFEQQLLAQLCNNQIPFETINLRMYASCSTITRESAIRNINTNSIIRHILPVAAIYPQMFAKYYAIADQTYDIAGDPILQKCIKHVLSRDVTVIIDLMARGYVFDMTSELVHLYIGGDLPLPLLSEHHIAEADPAPNANLDEPQYWQIDHGNNMYPIAQAEEVQKTLNDVAIFKLYLLRDEFSDKLECPDVNQVWVDILTSFDDDKLILAQKIHSVEQCKARLLYMEERGWFDAIVRCYEVFPTFNLEFWQDFWECYGDQILTSNDGGFFKYHMKTLNVDFLRWWLPRVNPTKYVNQRSIIGNSWVAQLAKELFPGNEEIQKIQPSAGQTSCRVY